MDRQSGSRSAIAITVLVSTLVCVGVRSASATTPQTPSRVYLVIDDSGTMAKRVGKTTRMDGAVDVAVRWAEEQEVPSPVTVELLAASDHVQPPIGVFSLRSETDRSALIEAIRQIQAIQNTKTLFGAVDADLAEVIGRDTGAGESFAVLFLTDAISDEPESDLRAEEIGDRVVSLESEVFGILLGDVPAVEALRRGRSVPRVAPSGRKRAGHASAVRALHTGFIRLDAPSELEGAIAPRFFGGSKPARREVVVENNAGLPRVVRFEAAAPGGVGVAFRPNPVLVPANGSAKVLLELTAPTTTEGDVAVIARVPGGRSQQHAMRVRLEPRSWLAEYAWVVVLLGLGGLLTLGSGLSWARRIVRVGHHGDEDKQVGLAIGDTVPLETFASGIDGSLRRGWSGFTIRAEEKPLHVGGRLVPPGRRSRYRLGEEIRSAQSPTFAIYPLIDGAMRGPGALDFSFDSPGTGWGNGGLR